MSRRLDALDRLPKELDFLRSIARETASAHYFPTWLDPNEYDKSVWKITFADGKTMTLVFDIELHDRSKLTDAKHNELLRCFKGWIAVQDAVSPITGLTFAPQTVRQHITLVVQLCDYFIINGERLQIAKHGLAAVNEADIFQLIQELASSSSIVNSIYRWKERLSLHLARMASTITDEDLAAARVKYPAIINIDFPQEDWIIDLTVDELVKARVWLLQNKYYRRGAGWGFTKAPSIVRLAMLALPQVIAPRRLAEMPLELCFGPNDALKREYVGVPVRKETDEETTMQSLRRYLSRIKQLEALADKGYKVPALAVRNVMANQEFFRQLKLGRAGRFVTFPKHVMFPMLCSALSFIESHGEDLVEAFLSIAKQAAKSDLGPRTFLGALNIAEHLGPRLRALGINRWSINLGSDGQVQTSDAEFFSQLRANVGLYELLLVLFGATTVATGLLTARRIGELVDLNAGSCLDDAGSWLIFDNRKSGVLGYREHLMRPIPKIIGKGLRRLEALQTGLINLGLLNAYKGILCVPRQDLAGLKDMHYWTIYGPSDLFCDYASVGLDNEQRRFYYRQHIGRRFFVLLFFWGSASGGMETLRWFLGHTDVEHLWHYLSESTPGEVMRQSMAQFAAEEAIQSSSAAAELRQVLQTHFGVERFSVMMADEVSFYIESLIDDGRIRIEPVFFQSKAGRQYEVLIKVIPRGDEG